MTWIALVLVFGILKGARDVIKKKALEKNSIIEVLFFYTFLSFIFVIPETKNALSMDMSFLGYIFIKSAVVFIAWICSFKAITKLPIGLYGIMDMSRVIFATGLGIMVLGEVMTAAKAVGMALVLVGLLMVNLRKYEKAEPSKGRTDRRFIVLTLASCFFNACSELLDKMLMRDLNSGQLQFWYMLFLVAFYLTYMLIKRIRIDLKVIFKNYWIPILSVLFVIGDRVLFMACADENSSVIAITLIKQCSVLITILGGKVVFKETDILKKMTCATVIIAGIMIALT